MDRSPGNVALALVAFSLETEFFNGESAHEIAGKAINFHFATIFNGAFNQFERGAAVKNRVETTTAESNN